MNYKSLIHEGLHNHGSNEKTKEIKNPLLRHAVVLLRSAGWSITHLHWFLKPELYFPGFEILLSDRCPLNCRCCIHFLPDYQKHYEEPCDFVIADMTKLLGAVSHIDELAITGGDPFLYKDLDKVLASLLESDKIGTVRVAATGNVLPTEKVLKLLDDPKLIIAVDNFGECSAKLNEMAKLNYPNIMIGKDDKTWPDFGNEKCRNRSGEELNRQYNACNSERACLLKGKVYACPRSARGADLGFFHDYDTEFFDLRNAEDNKQIQDGIKKLRSLKHLTACNYCNRATKDFVQIDASERLKG